MEHTLEYELAQVIADARLAGRQAELAGIAVDVRELDGLVVRKDRTADPERAVSLARPLVARHGATSIAVLARKLESTGLTTSTIRRLLEYHGDVTWLDEGQE